MNKVILFLVLIVLNVFGTAVAQVDFHIHDENQAEVSNSLEQLTQATNHQNHEDNCDASHCCRHCHSLVLLISPADLNISTNSFLLNFQDVSLQITEKSFEIIKPPLV